MASGSCAYLSVLGQKRESRQVLIALSKTVSSADSACPIRLLVTGAARDREKDNVYRRHVESLEVRAAVTQIPVESRVLGQHRKARRTPSMYLRALTTPPHVTALLRTLRVPEVYIRWQKAQHVPWVEGTVQQESYATKGHAEARPCWVAGQDLNLHDPHFLASPTRRARVRWCGEGQALWRVLLGHEGNCCWPVVFLCPVPGVYPMCSRVVHLDTNIIFFVHILGLVAFFVPWWLYEAHKKPRSSPQPPCLAATPFQSYDTHTSSSIQCLATTGTAPVRLSAVRTNAGREMSRRRCQSRQWSRKAWTRERSSPRK